MGLIDTHTHLDSFARRGDLPAVLQRAREAGLEAAVVIGTDPDDWPLYRELAGSSRRETAGVAGVGAPSGVISLRPSATARQAAAATGVELHYTVGLHPCNVGEDWAGRVAQLEAYWGGAASPIAAAARTESAPHPVALGETGLDRFHLPKDAAEAEKILGWQKASFAAQLQLAGRLGCPVVVHSRGAFRECVEMIDASGVDWKRVVFHCFTEGPAEMSQLKERGGYGSITGIVTYKNADALRAAVRAQGLDRLMIETDAPYLTPLPHRGKPNEPAYLRHTAEFCAELLGVSYDCLAEVTTANAKRFFSI